MGAAGPNYQGIEQNFLQPCGQFYIKLPTNLWTILHKISTFFDRLLHVSNFFAIKMLNFFDRADRFTPRHVWLQPYWSRDLRGAGRGEPADPVLVRRRLRHAAFPLHRRREQRRRHRHRGRRRAQVKKTFKSRLCFCDDLQKMRARLQKRYGWNYRGKGHQSLVSKNENGWDGEIHFPSTYHHPFSNCYHPVGLHSSFYMYAC